MKKIACYVVAKLLLTACAASVGLAILLTISSTASAQKPSLKGTFKDSFLVGAALNAAQFTEEDARGPRSPTSGTPPCHGPRTSSCRNRRHTC